MKLTIKIDEKTYQVDVDAEEPESTVATPRGYSVESAPVRVLAKSVAPTPSRAAPVNEEKVCRSPVSGIVVRVVAQAGQTIQVGDNLVVLEAMKMETSITAPFGKVAAIKVNPGESVQAGQVVVELA